MVLLYLSAHKISAQNQYVWVKTGTVEDYSVARTHYGSGISDLNGSTNRGPHLEGSTFGNALKNRISARYPNISTRFDPTLDQLKDNAVTAQTFTDGTYDQHEFCFFSGHGTRSAYQQNQTMFFTYDWAVTLSPFNSYYVTPPEQGPSLPTPTGFGGAYTKWVIFNACQTLFNETPEAYIGAFNGCHAILGHQSNMYYSDEEECRWEYWLFGYHCGEYWPTRDTKNQWNLFANYWVDGHIDNPNTYYGLWDCYSLAVKDQIYTHDRFGISPAIVWVWGYCPLTDQYGNGRNEHFTSNNSQYMWPVTSNEYFQYSGICYYHEHYGTPAY